MKALQHWIHGLGMVAGIEMLVKFWQSSAPDYMNFGTGISLIIAAVMGGGAAKTWSEKNVNPN